MVTILDYSYARPNLDQVKAAGYSGVMRYLSWPNLTPGKIIGKTELAGLQSRGFGVGLNWEYDAKDMLGGAAAGTAHAMEALRQARALGYPTGCGIVFSADFDATEAQQVPINGYLSAAKAVLRGYYLTGVYGGYWVVKRSLDAGAAEWAWQTYAWSGGQWDPRAALRQVQNGITVGGGECDRNTVSGTLPIWWPNTPTSGGTMATQEQLNWDYSIGAPSLGVTKPAADWIKEGYKANQKLDALAAAVAADAVRDAVMLAALQTAAAGGTSLDTASVITAVNVVRDEARTAYARIAELEAEVEQLRDRLADAAHAQADALGPDPTP